MARGDARIDFETNDLIFKKSSSNVLNDAEFNYDVLTEIATIKIKVPEIEFVNDTWRSYEAYIDGYLETPEGVDDKLVYVEYYYTAGNSNDGQKIPITSFLLTAFLEGSTPSVTTVGEFRILNDTLLENKRSLKITHYSAEVYSVMEIKVSAKTTFEIVQILQPSNKSLKVSWGDTESDILTGDIDNFIHTFADGAVPHTIIIEECDFTSITSITLGRGALLNGILSVSLPRDLVSLEELRIDYTEELTEISLPDTMVKLERLWGIASNVSEIIIPSSLIDINEIAFPIAANITSFIASRLWGNLNFIQFNDTTLDINSVNQILVELDNNPTLAAGGGANIAGGSTPPPDSNSGGNDGITAYWSLIDKGYIAIINSPIPARPVTFPIPKVVSGFDGTIRQDEVVSASAVPSAAIEVESFVSETILLGDFFVENSINQNQYILLNLNEGSLLQNPTYGVGIPNYIQAPTTNQELLNAIVEKFAQDSLRVIGIRKIDEAINVESEDFNII